MKNYEYKIGDIIYYNDNWSRYGGRQTRYHVCVINKIVNNKLWGYWKIFNQLPTEQEIINKEYDKYNYGWMGKDDLLEVLKPVNKNRRINR